MSNEIRLTKEYLDSMVEGNNMTSGVGLEQLKKQILNNQAIVEKVKEVVGDMNPQIEILEVKDIREILNTTFHSGEQSN